MQEKLTERQLRRTVPCVCLTALCLNKQINLLSSIIYLSRYANSADSHSLGSAKLLAFSDTVKVSYCRCEKREFWTQTKNFRPSSAFSRTGRFWQQLMACCLSSLAVDSDASKTLQEKTKQKNTHMKTHKSSVKTSKHELH